MNEPKWSWTKLPLLRNAAALLQFRELVAIPIWFKWETLCSLIWREKPWSLMKFVHVCPSWSWRFFLACLCLRLGMCQRSWQYMLTFFPKRSFFFQFLTAQVNQHRIWQTPAGVDIRNHHIYRDDFPIQTSFYSGCFFVFPIFSIVFPWFSNSNRSFLGDFRP